MAAAQQVHVLGVGNYYGFSTYRAFAELSKSMKVFPLFGVELTCVLGDLRGTRTLINDPGNPGKMYLCGKGITRFDPMPPDAVNLMDMIRRVDAARMDAMIQKLDRQFVDRGGLDLHVTGASLRATLAQRYALPEDAICLQERHVAQAFQEGLFAQVAEPLRAHSLRLILDADPGSDRGEGSVQGAIRSRLMKAGMPCYVEESPVGFDHGYKLVLALGGVPCYPVLADGVVPTCAFEEPIEGLVAWLKEGGIHCAEFIPNRNSPGVLTAYASTLRSAGFIVLGGTEHNGLDVPPLEPHCAGGAEVPEPVKEIFWEGACVVAAHEFLTANGHRGYVDEAGKLQAGFASSNARITAFAKIGSEVMASYWGRGQMGLPTPSLVN